MFPMSSPLARLARTRGASGLLACLVALAPSVALHAETDQADDSKAITTMFGAGYQRLPTWIGSRNDRYQAVPFVLFDWPKHVTFSTVDGLTVDLIRGEKLSGGPYANYMWGRDRKDLSRKLSRIVKSLSPRLHVGGYLEYQITKPWSIGGRLSHDTQGAGAYLDLYTDYDLPAIGYIEHSLELEWRGMNGAAMRRFFGVKRTQARRLNTQRWTPDASGEEASITYDAFIPTSLHTGFVASIEYSRLLGLARSSPLIKRFGTPNQFATSLAFVYRL